MGAAVKGNPKIDEKAKRLIDENEDFFIFSNLKNVSRPELIRAARFFIKAAGACYEMNDVRRTQEAGGRKGVAIKKANNKKISN